MGKAWTHKKRSLTKEMRSDKPIGRPRTYKTEDDEAERLAAEDHSELLRWLW
jgi:hypothetical protein